LTADVTSVILLRMSKLRGTATASALFGLVLIISGCSSGESDAAKATTTVEASSGSTSRDHAVGVVTRTLVDTSRPTSANGEVPGTTQRTIETTVFYPADGGSAGETSPDAPGDTSEGPYPLVVLSHGFGGNIAYLSPLGEAWAKAGYVVALPLFPLTHGGTPGGVQGGDVENQPGDVSFVIDEVLAESDSTNSTLSGLVDGDAIAVSGHSNGGITTMGVIANSCCRDPRVDAAVVLSGVDSPYSTGSYDMSDTPPVLFVHGVNDEAIAYNQVVTLFNQLQAPKGLLTLEQATHGSYLVPSDPGFAVTEEATTDFLDAELRDDDAARGRLAQIQAPGVATMHWAPDEASDVSVDTIPEPETNRKATVSAQDQLRDGQSVTVTWSGFLPGKTINIVQCVGDGRGGTATCDVSGNGKVLQPDPTGEGSLELVVRAGPVANGVCDSTNPCTILVNDSGLQDEDAFIYFPITFAP
jgi:predicted dienelactone hydrolase